MREYSKTISLTKNARGVYSLDPSIGCASGMQNEHGGCFGECYAAKSSKLYGYDFSKTVLRDFETEYHRRLVVKQIDRIKLDFVRMGTSGDPSENWEHTINICKKIDNCNKQIVIITKHWTNLTDEHLHYLSTINVCINTSVSALDKIELIDNAVEQYKRLKPFCKSVLRIVSCDFNKDNPEGFKRSLIQDSLFKNESTLDTVLRVNKNNKYAKDGIINISETTFLGKKCHVSKFNRKTYFGKCSNCHEMCGINSKPSETPYPVKRSLPKQLTLFRLRLF
jgi:hypothetical protein